MEHLETLLTATNSWLLRGKLTLFRFVMPADFDNSADTREAALRAFQKLLLRINNNYRVLPLSDAVLGLRAGQLPGAAASITFDQGSTQWLHAVASQLEQQQLHATFFISSGQFFGHPLWSDRLRHAVLQAAADIDELVLPSIAASALKLGNTSARLQTISQLESKLRAQESAPREQYLQQIETQLKSNPMQTPRLLPEQVRALHGRGFSIGSQTISNAMLTCCPATLAYQEIGQSKEQLEGLIKGRVQALAYPFGEPGLGYRSEHMEMVSRCGYCLAVSTQPGLASHSTSVLQLPRCTPALSAGARLNRQLWQQKKTHAQRLRENESGKSVLMVAFHFPPQAGSSGVLRTLNFVKNLPAHNWHPTVLTASPRAYVESRTDLVASIPAATRILRGFALDASRHLSLFGKYPAAFAWPDRWSSWWPGAVLAGLQEIRRKRPQLIWSTYPIATAHGIAASLARLSGLPWVADFRDPMLTDTFPAAGVQRRLWNLLEQQAMREAAFCVFTTARAATAYQQRYPAAAHKCRVIENGYDESAFEQVQAQRSDVDAGKLVLLHSGLIYPRERDPSALFAALRSLIDQGLLRPEQLQLRFRAAHHEKEVLACASRFSLETIVDLAPAVPYRQAIAEMLAADGLLVIQGSQFNAQIPAKIYEYLRAQRPLLALVDPQGDSAAFLANYQQVWQADSNNHDAIKTVLLIFFEQLRRERPATLFQSNCKQLEKYSRAAQTQRLVELFDRLHRPDTA
ncbi:polysaccharide deacetylase family protein [Hydrogenophaga sp.]|uniref:polysaccharide deacetylase family protein n=1 Tax=Hydrogenophaga sp. TaxID=1904254 RepID=UPI0019A7E38F|nr:polysaccharide deacetylase family protein [Hydrogenophaga sp.]MBD3893566.1 hypothetical protein [Hydrogenophaga sp.]